MNISEFLKSSSLQRKKLHLGCGSVYKEGWCNIDYYEGCETDTHRGDVANTPDVWCNIKRLSCEDETIDVIALYHVLEHFYKYEVFDILDEFLRVLKPGGICIIEMPDLSRILWLLLLVPLREELPGMSDKDAIESQFYGASWERNEKCYPYHKYVWRRKEFVDFCLNKGFDIVLKTGATLSHKPTRDMAIVLTKKLPQSLYTADSRHTRVDEILQYGNKPRRILRQLRSYIKMNLLGIRSYLRKINNNA